MTTCCVANCDRQIKTAGMCGMHYQRMRKHGNLDKRRNAHGEGWIDKYGYKHITINGIRRREHLYVVESTLNKPLPKRAVVHHIDGDRLNNNKSNLVVCPNNAYHKLIHARQEALERCGDANKRKCWICGKYDATTNMREVNRNFIHKLCHTQYEIARRFNKQ